MTVDPQDVLVFAEVVRSHGFSAAARALDLPQSAVSRRVKRLEKALGVRLLHRTTRRVGLTPEGRVYFEHVARLPRLLDEASQAVHAISAAPTGTLRVAAPPEDGTIIWETLRGFSVGHPDVELEVVHSLEYVDLIDAEIDVALRGGAPPDSPDLVVQQLWDSRILLAASPEYLERRGTPTRVEELSEHDGVCMDSWAPNALRRLEGDRGHVRVTMRNRLRSNSLTTARNAALDGLGIAPLLKLTCQDDLDRGALVEVLQGALPMSAKGWYVYPVARQRSVAAQALLAHLAQVARANLER